MNKLISKLVEDSADLLEFGFDKILDNETIKDFPVIGTFVKLGLAKKSISDFIFLKKLDLFLNDISIIPKVKFEEFKNKLDEDETFRIKLSEGIIILLDKFNHLEKPLILARLFRALIDEKIEKTDFFRLANAVELTFIDDLNKFIQGKENYHILMTMVSSGLSELSYSMKVNKDPFDSPKVDIEVRRTNLGRQLQDVLNAS